VCDSVCLCFVFFVCVLCVCTLCALCVCFVCVCVFCVCFVCVLCLCFCVCVRRGTPITMVKGVCRGVRTYDVINVFHTRKTMIVMKWAQMRPTGLMVSGKCSVSSPIHLDGSHCDQSGEGTNVGCKRQLETTKEISVGEPKQLRTTRTSEEKVTSPQSGDG